MVCLPAGVFYVLCLPLKRDDVVRTRYLFGILFALIMGGAGFLLIWVYSIIRGWQLSLMATLLGLYLVFAGTITVQAVMLPVLYKFEAEKAKLICMAIYMIPVVGGMYLINWMRGGMPSKEMIQGALLISPVLLVILITISFMVSARIYRGKDV